MVGASARRDLESILDSALDERANLALLGGVGDQCRELTLIQENNTSAGSSVGCIRRRDDVSSGQNFLGAGEEVRSGVPVVFWRSNDRGREERKESEKRCCVHVERRLW